MADLQLAALVILRDLLMDKPKSLLVSMILADDNMRESVGIEYENDVWWRLEEQFVEDVRCPQCDGRLVMESYRDAVITLSCERCRMIYEWDTDEETFVSEEWLGESG